MGVAANPVISSAFLQIGIDIVPHQFSKVVNILSEQRGDTQIVCSGFPILIAQLLVHIHTGEVQQRMLVIWSVFGFDLVVVSRHAIVPSVHHWLDRILLIEHLFAFVQGFLAFGQITEKQLGVCDR